jgi:hypothetical protein
LTVAVAEPSAQVVREELWTSFASLLRSYVAAHGLQHMGEEGAHVEISGNEILVRRGGRVLEFKLDAASGHGVWSFHGVTNGSFTLSENGMMKFEEAPEEMDMAAERMARMLYAFK